MVNSDDTNRENFYSVLKKKLEVYRDSKQHLDRFLSTDFNVFKWIEPENKDLLPDQIRRFENRRSAIIADLLNPSGSHGQDRKFLDAFLDVIKRPDLKDKKRPKVDRESPTYRSSENPHGQIDILVEFENFGLGIENKLDADEQKKQLQGYYEHLKEEYGGQGFCLVFITPDGRKPNSIEPNLREKLMNEKKSKLVCVSYSTGILKWLEECCQLGESDKFRWFLRDFKDHINGGQTMSMENERETILKHAQESEENLKTALDIGFAFSELQNGGLQNSEFQKRIIVGFLNKLGKFVVDKLGDPDESRWKVNDDSLRDSPLKKDKIFSFGEKSWEDQYGVALSADTSNACDVLIGVWTKDNKKVQELFKLLKEKLDDSSRKKGKKEDPWGWYYHLDPPYLYWNTKETLIKLYNGEAVKHIGEELVKTIKVAAPIIDKHVRKL